MRSLTYMLRRIIAVVAGSWCDLHNVGYRSDLCPHCMGHKLAQLDRIDRAPEWTKAEGAWPIRRNAGDRTPTQ